MNRTLGVWRTIYENNSDGEDVFVANEGVCSDCAGDDHAPYTQYPFGSLFGSGEPHGDMGNDWSDCFFCGRPITGRRGLDELGKV